MSNSVCRWGILSTAVIGQKNWKAIRNSGNGTVVAVASRRIESSQQFIDQCQSVAPFESVPVALGSYDELLQRDDVDAVYIPLPTGMRKEWVIRAAQAGKHVMCEKPCAPSASDLMEMIQACHENGVQFMDGVMYMHSQRMTAIRKALDEPQYVGKIKRITSQFSFCADESFKQSNIRTDSRMEPQGCLGDLGWYTIRFGLWVMNYELPREVTGRILAEHHREESPEAVPMEFSGEMFFDNGISAGFYNSFLTQHQQWANISGDNGLLHVFDFVLPYDNSSNQNNNQLEFLLSNSDFVVDGCDFAMKNQSQTVALEESSHSTENSQETRLFKNFNDLVNNESVDPLLPEISLKTQKVMDACLQSARNGSEPVVVEG